MRGVTCRAIFTVAGPTRPNPCVSFDAGGGREELEIDVIRRAGNSRRERHLCPPVVLPAFPGGAGRQARHSNDLPRLVCVCRQRLRPRRSAGALPPAPPPPAATALAYRLPEVGGRPAGHVVQRRPRPQGAPVGGDHRRHGGRRRSHPSVRVQRLPMPEPSLSVLVPAVVRGISAGGHMPGTGSLPDWVAQAAQGMLPNLAKFSAMHYSGSQNFNQTRGEENDDRLLRS